MTWNWRDGYGCDCDVGDEQAAEAEEAEVRQRSTGADPQNLQSNSTD